MFYLHVEILHIFGAHGWFLQTFTSKIHRHTLARPVHGSRYQQTISDYNCGSRSDGPTDNLKRIVFHDHPLVEYPL